MLQFLTRMMRLAAVAFALGGASLAHAQDATAPPQIAPLGQPAAPAPDRPDPVALIDKAKGRLEQALAALKRDSLDDAALLELNAQLDPAAADVQSAIDILTPRLANSKARLDQLGPKPDAKAPPESPSVTADRAEQERIYNAMDESLKRARLLALQIEQTDNAIVSRRRAIFVSALFQRSRGIVSPNLWGKVADEIGGDVRALDYVGGDFVSSLPDKLAGWRGPAFLGLVALVALLNIPLYRLVQRILSREPSVHEPDRLARALGACWVAIVAAIAPIVTILILFALADAFDLIGPRLLPLKRSLLEAVTRIALTAGLARGLLAPSRPNWRLIAISDAPAERLSRLAIAVAIVVSVAKIIDSMNEIIGASLPLTAATQGLGAFIFAAVIGGALFGIGEDRDEDEECLGPKIVAPPRWLGALRLLTWALIVVIAIAALWGYIPLASFLADQVVWIAGVAAALFILVPLLTETIEHAFQPQTRFGRMFVANLGARREGLTQFGILLSGTAQLLLLGIGAFAIAAPWGVQSDDFAGALRSAFFGFSIGDVTVSPSSIIVALVLFALGYAATRGVQEWLDQRLMPATNLDAGLRNSIRTSVGYIGFIVAASLALAHVGLGLDKIAIVAGALSVGIGFGLQSIVNNFVSGLIVLWERAVRVGDLVVIGDEQGFVRKINVRATEIETFDRATMIVPNSNLITGVVKNWVRNDRVARIKIAVTLNTGVDPEKVREIMTGAAKGHENVAKIPAPTTLFVSIDSSGLKFELICFVEDVEVSGRVKSDLNYEIFGAFVAAGMSVGSTPTVQVLLQGHAAEDVARAITASG